MLFKGVVSLFCNIKFRILFSSPDSTVTEVGPIITGAALTAKDPIINTIDNNAINNKLL